MNRSVDVFKQRLAQAGVTLNEPSSTAPLASPWFVRALQAFSGWLAALFLLGFIGMGMIFVAKSAVASLMVGGTLIVGAFALLRTTQSDVLEHMALVFSLAGQSLVAMAVIGMLPGTVYLWWVLLALQCALALVMPSQVHRGVSAFLASHALTMALGFSGGQVATGLVLLMLTLLWLNECRWPGRISAVQAWGAGLLAWLLVVKESMFFTHLFWSYDYFNPENQLFTPWFASWLGTALVALALLSVIQQTFRQHSQPAITQRLVIYGAVVLVAVVSVYMPGLGAGVTVLLLGFSIGHRVLMGSGVLLLLMAVSRYYYWLDVTLLMKSLMLLAMGALLLTLRWVLKRWLLNRWRTLDKSAAQGDANEH